MSLLTEWETMKKAADLSIVELIEAMNAGDARAKVRFLFCKWAGRIMQAQAQIKPPSPIAIRRMELQAAEAIMEAIIKPEKGKA